MRKSVAYRIKINFNFLVIWQNHKRVVVVVEVVEVVEVVVEVVVSDT